ncbi:MFS general substrate transporter [Mycena floridula]|nr:MFS general substrate transporter [Mycena floridula]
MSLYPGSGTSSSPFIVSFPPNDPHNPYNWSHTKKWLVTAQLALATWTVSFSSSAYAGGLANTEVDLGISQEIAVLGISLYVLGFAVGPLLFAPLSEMIGRRPVAIGTLALYTPLHVLVALGGSVKGLGNVQTLLACRLLTGIFGSSPLTNAGATIADIWSTQERGKAAAIYASVPFLGPIVGPIVGSFAAQSPTLGWRFNFWLMFVFGAISLISALFVGETYAPVLIRQRVSLLTETSREGEIYLSVFDITPKASGVSRDKMYRGTSLPRVLWSNLKRPFVLSQASDSEKSTTTRSSLAFMGIGIGIIIGTISSFTWGEAMYQRSLAKERVRLENDAEKSNKRTERGPVVVPEARLPTAITGSILLPLGLFWFAIIIPNPTVLASPTLLTLSLLPFGIGIAQLLQSTTAYMMDAYGIWFASATAGVGVFRSITGALFPLFSTPMFLRLGDQGTMLFFAGLTTVIGIPIIACVWRYGKWMRKQIQICLQQRLSSGRDPSYEAHHRQSHWFTIYKDSSFTASCCQVQWPKARECSSFDQQLYYELCFDCCGGGLWKDDG